ncbi:MAG: hypothetical protein J6P93_03475 [Alphaproteobacteria bacterium]|nr:hypothetical protein [Alphaproteobacteria bacterium]
MKKWILSPLFAPITAILTMLVLGVGAIVWRANGCDTFFDDGNVCDIVTYTFYVLLALSLIFLRKDFKDNGLTWCVLLFLNIAAILREAGIQHWLTSTDTTAIKLRFFTNPKNPLSEKIIAGALVLLVLGAVFYLIFKYTPKIWRGFWKKEPMYWSICFLCGMGVFGKIADRFHGNWVKYTGQALSDDAYFLSIMIEETSEATLPLIALIALIQWHLMKGKK